MGNKQSLNHTVWDCKYHIVWIPKCRKKVLYGGLRKYLGEVFRGLARQKECRVIEGHLMSDHLHMLVSIPPKYSVSQVVGFMKGKSAMIIFEKYSRLKKNFRGHSFWARGYYVSTVGLDEGKIRKYIQDQETNETIEEHYDTDLSNPF